MPLRISFIKLELSTLPCFYYHDTLDVNTAVNSSFLSVIVLYSTKQYGQDPFCMVLCAFFFFFCIFIDKICEWYPEIASGIWPVLSPFAWGIIQSYTIPYHKGARPLQSTNWSTELSLQLPLVTVHLFCMDISLPLTPNRNKIIRGSPPVYTSDELLQ